jgi:hypothetical protein
MKHPDTIRTTLIRIIEESFKKEESKDFSAPPGFKVIEDTFPGFDKLNDIDEYSDIATIYSILDEYEDSISHNSPDSGDYKALLQIALEYLKRNEKIDDPRIDAFFKKRK